jgi:hypothetical protein
MTAALPSQKVLAGAPSGRARPSGDAPDPFVAFPID